jgi:glycosyltransferase involved in cell wall biosynthesis
MNVFKNSLQSLEGRAESALSQGKVNVALRLIHDFVERIVTEPLCVSQVFGSRDLDQLCLRIGRQNLSSLCVRQEVPWPLRTSRSRIVYVVSRLQRSGGHSRLVQDFIRAQPDKDHLILSTGVGGPSDEDYLSKMYADNDSVCFLAAPHTDLQSRLTWMQSMLAGSQPEHVHLLNHHQDSVAVAALVPELGLKGTFLHHGDHHLCLGVYMGHLTHVDLHPMGYHYCRDELGVDNRYLPLTFEDKYFVPVQTGFASGGCLTTATAARFNKVEIPYYISYLDTIPRVLKVTGGRHIHIGKLTPWALRRMRTQMRKNGVPEDSLIYIEWTPSVWKSLQEHAVDVYIASFPYGGGVTLIEAMGAGVPVIMHQHMHSRVLSGLELAYPEAFRWADSEVLLSHLAAIEPERLEREKRLSRQRYETFHRPEILRAYLHDPDLMQLPIPPLMSEFKPRYDEWAAWAESQLSFSRLAYRFAYRTWRRLRSVFS